MLGSGTAGRRGVALVCAAAALIAAAPGGLPRLAALARIEPGQWQIKTVGADGAPRSVCLADPATLLHYGRRAATCEHDVVTDQADLATVQYRCAASGSGRTTLSVATPRAFNLNLQGLDGGLPYEESYEAHRLGACGAKSR